MGSQRVASSMAEVPSQIASPPASGGGEGGEEFASANLSSPDDPVIIDFISTMNCVYNASIDLAFDESLSMPELDQINFHNCEGVAFPPEELAQEDPMCLCEQSVYWGNIYGADCSSRNVMYWYHPDYLGSVEAITDVRGEVYQLARRSLLVQFNGSEGGFFHNTIWGEPLQDQKAFTYKDFSSRFRFNGKERDEETGNYYYGARYYDPRVSLWLSVDPLASDAPGWTPYRFSFNNPLKFVDPNGLFETEDIIFTNNTGDEIGRIILPGPDVVHQLDTDFTTDDPIEVDPIKMAELTGMALDEIDAVGIDFGVAAVVGGGVHFGEGVVHFLDGENEGETYAYGYKGGGTGLDFGVGGSGFVSSFDNDADKEFLNAEKWQGNYSGYSVGAGSVNLNYSWSNKDNKRGQIWPGQNFPARKASPALWHTWTMGGAYSGEARVGASIYWGQSYLQKKL